MQIIVGFVVVLDGDNIRRENAEVICFSLLGCGFAIFEKLNEQYEDLPFQSLSGKVC